MLVATLTDRGCLLGDSAYDNNPLYDAAFAHGHPLLAARRYPKAKGVGHHRHSPYRLHALELLEHTPGRRLLDQRRQIETCFGNCTSFGGGLTHLPPWVRRLHRVRLGVNAKLIINAIRILVLRKRKQKLCA